MATFTFGYNTELCEKIEGIPGLRVHGAEGMAVGSVDAIAAARLRAGHTVEGFIKLAKVGATRAAFPDLRKYQRRGVRFLVNVLREHGGAILADDMGLGKTLQALTAMKLLLKENERALILCPAAARETWRDELAKWGFTSTAVLSPTATKAAKKEWEDASSKRVLVCSYHPSLIDRTLECAFPRGVPAFLILDEAHRLRGRNSLRSKTLKDIAPLTKYRLALSATPQMDHPRDWYQLLHTLLGYRFGNRWDFDRAYCAARPNKYGGQDNRGVSNPEELKLRLSYYMLRREKRDVAKELPAMQWQVRWVEPTTDAKRVFQAAQLGLSKGSMHEAVLATLKGKTEETISLAKEAKRFLLATWLREHAQQLARSLSVEHDTPCVCITGDLSTEKRAAKIREAQSKGWGVVATTDSISESLNLQGVASIGILHALDWVPLKLAQLFGRLHRLGITDPVTWYIVAMRESIDQVIVQTQILKLDQWRGIMGQTSHRDFRHAIGDAVSGPQVVEAEKQALKDMYEAMK